MEECASSSKSRTFKVSSIMPRERLKETWNEVIKSDLKERNVGKHQTKYRNAWKSFIRNLAKMEGTLKQI